MHHALRTVLSIAAFLLWSASEAPAALVLHYTFDTIPLGELSDGESIPNSAGYAAPGRAVVVPDGPIDILGGQSPAGGNFARMSSQSEPRFPVSYIDTAVSFVDLGLTHLSEWTMMAWVRFEPFQSDNFVFTQDGFDPPYLHYGARFDGGQPRFYSGHWTDDWISDQAVVQLDVWQHVAWTNDSSGSQMIYVNGESISLVPTIQGGQPFELDRNILIGGINGIRNLEGAIDDVRIYDELLDASTIAALARPIPEPSPALMLALSAAGLRIRRR